jgi:signal transduction histidine kinase
VADDDAEWLLSSLADQTAIALESTRNDDVRHLLEGRLDELLREQEGKDRAIQIMSHDLRTPLTALVGYAALLNSEVLGPLNDRQQATLQRMKLVCDHMESVLSNVLEMARLSGGRFQMAIEEVDLRALVAAALDVVRPAADRAGIRLQMNHGAPFPVRTDSSRLRLVLVQLLDNAIKYSPDGCQVYVRLATVQQDGRSWAQLEVIDEGPGIEPERQQEIFEPYVRRDGLSGRAKGGIGLGLPIARGVVERLGGTLSLDSAPGQGACFRILLPS